MIWDGRAGLLSGSVEEPHPGCHTEALSGPRLPNWIWHRRLHWPEEVSYGNPGELVLLTFYRLPQP